MNKYIKWGIVAAILIGATIMGFRTFTPKVNEDLKAVPTSTKGKQSRELNVKAVIIKESSLSDEFFVSGSIIPDEEVDLTFETQGKITDIFFKEGSRVSKGELLAKINDAPLQAELRKLESQLKLYTDRMHRQ
ncbi:MAG: biotin/lipoyl-binding protein, partial [Bacteroidaceae bacterium]|nr:biotin/lipoyl-binding protein [Bacteroidaceae bacterium]